MRGLRLASSVSEINSVFCDMHESGRPGFQIAPDVPIAQCVGTLETYLQTQLGLTAFRFDVATGNAHPEHAVDIDVVSDGTGQHDAGRHIDEFEARVFAGIAVHHNINGYGHVTLQLARLGVEGMATGRYSRLRDRMNSAGLSYRGSLEPGMKTVFSEGLVAVHGTHRIRLGPAYHEFISEPDQQSHRLWTRYSSTIELNPHIK